MINAEAWLEFEQHRKEIKKPLTPLAIKKLKKKLATLSLDSQQLCIDASIENGWTGLFTEKFKGAGNARGSEGLSGQSNNSATRHHDRLKKIYEEAVAEELGSETVQQISSDLQSQMAIKH